jgi:hypothetical protein
LDFQLHPANTTKIGFYKCEDKREHRTKVGHPNERTEIQHEMVTGGAEEKVAESVRYQQGWPREVDMAHRSFFSGKLKVLFFSVHHKDYHPIHI